MIIVFDLDYTILDSVKLKKALARAMGVSRAEYVRTYKRHFTEQKKHYNPYEHLDFLNKADRAGKIKAVTKAMDVFLYPAAKKYLPALKKNAQLIMLTAGNLAWQKEKIVGLKASKYFSKIIFVEKDKREALRFLKNSQEDILIINDKPRELVEMSAVLPQAVVCLVRGPYSNNIPHDFKIHKLGYYLRRLVL